MVRTLSHNAELAWLELVEAAYDAADDVDSGSPLFFPSAYYAQCLEAYHRAMEQNDRDLWWDKKCAESPGMIECRIYDC